MTAAITIALLSLVGLGFFLSAIARRRAAFRRSLCLHGFRRQHDPLPEAIDFTITIQWPEARGIQYLQCFAKDGEQASTTVANIRCFETTGTRMGKTALMKSDEIQQTVIAIRCHHRNVARVAVCPRNFAHQFRLWVEGGNEMELGDTDFARIFCVFSFDGNAEIEWLSPDVQASMLENCTIILEAGGNTVLLYEQGKQLSGAELERGLELAEAIEESITSRC